jgi:DNA-binding XRE family transcriptional regulator
MMTILGGNMMNDDNLTYDDPMNDQPRKIPFKVHCQARTKIGLKLYSLRIKHRLCQEDAANCCDITQSMWNKIENGLTKDPTLKTLIRIANAFGISLDDLVARKRVPPKVKMIESTNPLPFQGS